MRPRIVATIWLAVALVAGAPSEIRLASAQTPDYALHDGDVVVTLGDSNTAPGMYQQVLERYTVMRYPGRHVRFLNMGIGGETAANGLARLPRDVFDRGATVLIVTYGINDICWGFCAYDAHKQAYYDAIVNTVVQAVNHNVRVFVTTYPYTGFDFPVLHDMTVLGTQIATYLGQKGIDIYPTMKALDTTNGNAQCVADAAQCPAAFVNVCRASCNTWAPNDGVHLGEKGHRAWAYALVKGLGAPASVSSVTVDAPSQSVVAATGSTVTNVVWNAAQRRLTFSKLDDGQALTFDSNTETYFHNLEVPFHTLAGTLLKVTNLPAGTYRLTAAGERLADVASTVLANPGVDLSALAPAQWSYGGPWMYQNPIVAGITSGRAAANRLLLNATGSTVQSFLGTADGLAGLVQHWAATPSNNAFVIEPAP